MSSNSIPEVVRSRSVQSFLTKICYDRCVALDEADLIFLTLFQLSESSTDGLLYPLIIAGCIGFDGNSVAVDH
jgi:hypothetical protein